MGKKIEHGLYVVPVQYTWDPNSRGNDSGSTKDLIAVPLCHIHYNAKTNIDDFNVTDIFDAKWGNQTFILPLDLRPFDNIGKTFKKYHRDYNQISNKQKQQQQQRHHQKKASSTSSIIPKPINNENNDNKKIINIKNNKNRTFNHDTYKFEPP